MRQGNYFPIALNLQIFPIVEPRNQGTLLTFQIVAGADATSGIKTKLVIVNIQQP
jgi:hypothetical protein